MSRKWYGIVGSRGFTNKQLVIDFVKSIKHPNGIVSGGCKNSPDQYAEEEAIGRKLSRVIFEPHWSPSPGKINKGAAFERNKEIAAFCDVLVAFYDGSSNGTKHVMEEAKKLGKRVIVFDADGNHSDYESS